MVQKQLIFFFFCGKVLIIGITSRFKSSTGFGFNFGPAAAPSIPLQVAANSPFPFGPAGCAAAFCPPPTIILAPSFSVPSFFPPPFAPPPFPPPYPYPPPSPYFFNQQESPKKTLISNLINAFLAKKGKDMPQPSYQPQPPLPPTSPAQYPLHVTINLFYFLSFNINLFILFLSIQEFM